MKHILLLEDDEQLAKSTVQVLKPRWRLTWVSTTQQAFDALEKRNFDVALLDVGLAESSGLDVAEYIRACSSQTKIIVISGQTELPNRLLSYQSGADDFLSKPFVAAELESKLITMSGLYRLPQNRTYQIADLKFDVEQSRVTTPLFTANLRPRESQVLACLCKHTGRVLTKEQIISDVWGTIDPPTYTTVDVYIRRVRNALGPTYRGWIKTYRGVGFAWQPPVTKT